MASPGESLHQTISCLIRSKALSLSPFPAGLVLFVVVHLVMKLVTRLLNRVQKLNDRLRKITLTAVKAVLYVLTAIITAGALGVNTTSLTAIMSVLTLGVTLAAEDILGNVAGGLVILSSHPFSLGDVRRTYELLGAGFSGAKLHPTLVRRPPGHVSEIMHNEGEDFVYVLEGCMLLEVGGERHILNKGDSMHFQSHLPHRSATLGNETTLELWVRTQPLFS